MLFLWHYMRLQQPTSDKHEQVAELYGISKDECLKCFNDIKSVLEQHAKRMETTKKIEELRELLEANKLKQRRSSPV
ncbi:uncharacterized protein N7498_008416 [Penicillium cinerascens]|uniref:Uncharacterized protein n=1 Tax=Penicillium cinerascens TaxID=70096 RepID=A0A9W9MAM7_9EURO|nr:uncharacterized protein N7498_008416 [Penicillium cinerascens]KAJ5194978.1 hypothetical protein N7498_008416 [Penicillium cinerascens]